MIYVKNEEASSKDFKLRYEYTLGYTKEKVVFASIQSLKRVL